MKDLKGLIKLAEQGDADAQYDAANMLMIGKDGVEQGIAAAILLYTKAANQGDSASQYALATHYCTKWKAEHDEVAKDSAIFWARKVKESDHAISSQCIN